MGISRSSCFIDMEPKEDFLIFEGRKGDSPIARSRTSFQMKIHKAEFLNGGIAMPIIGSNKDDVHIEYKMPDEIKNKIPKYFPAAFAGELCSTFGPKVFEKDEDNIYNLSYLGGTAGWAEALKMTCKKLGLDWLWKYYNSLDWFDSDLFDGEVEDMIISKFIENTTDNTVYMKFLQETSLAYNP